MQELVEAVRDLLAAWDGQKSILPALARLRKALERAQAH